MGGDFDGSAGGSGGRFPGAFMSAGTSSFADFLGSYAPGLLPGNVPLPSGPGTHPWPPASESSLIRDLPHATTIVAAVCREGVVMAGDRRATSGNMIAQRDIEKVLRCDEYSCVGFSGVAGLATEMVRLFQVELEHYEKLEGRTLSLEGKANRLATMIRANLGGAMQGLVVVPLFAGFDEDAKRGRIFSYDVVGGRYEEHLYQGLGSGSLFARGSLKKLYVDDMPLQDAALACMHALYDAADEDSATGGPDVIRSIYPVIATITDDGFVRLSDGESEQYSRTVIEGRMRAPGGPRAPLHPAT